MAIYYYHVLNLAIMRVDTLFPFIPTYRHLVQYSNLLRIALRAMLEMLKSGEISLDQPDYPLMLLLGISKGGRSTAIAVGNVRHDHISGIDHPSVSL